MKQKLRNRISNGYDFRKLSNLVYGRANLPATFTSNHTTTSYSVKYLYSATDSRIYKNNVNHEVIESEEYYLKDALGRDIAVWDLYNSQLTFYAFANGRFAQVGGNTIPAPMGNVRAGGNFSSNPTNLSVTNGRVNPTWTNTTGSRITTQVYSVTDHLSSLRIAYHAMPVCSTYTINPPHEPERIITETSIVYTPQTINDYFPYGKTLRTFVNGEQKYAFGSKERDTETGNDYFEARFLDTDIGRFLSVDPLAAMTPGWNPYRYAFNNPIGFVDPTGNLEGEYELDLDKNWVKTSDKGDEINVDFYHFDNEDGSQTTYVTDREGNWNFISEGREALKGLDRDTDVDYEQIYDEFTQGVGPEYSLIEGDHPMNNELKKDGWLGAAHMDFILGGKDRDRYVNNFGIGGLVASGFNMQLQMMGSYTASFYKLGDKTLTLVFDSKSRQSLYYNAGVPNYNRGAGRSAESGMGQRQTNTYQTYLFFK